MSKDLPDLRTQAVEIKDATLQGENTADRVGGMLVDLVDYLDTLHIDQVHLGAFLTALNNSDPHDPSEGVVLTFLGSDWGFSTAVTRLQISHERIRAQMASDEETMRALEDNFSQTIQDVDRQLVDLYGQDARFATWQEQTDMHIISIAGVFDPETGELIGYSNITQTATEISQSVVGQKMNNLADPDMWEQGTTDNEVTGKTYDEIKRDSTTCLRTKPLLPVSEDSYILFTPTNNNYSIYVLYFNSEKKLCSSATHLSPGWIRLRDEAIGKKAIIEQDDVQYVAFMLKKNDDSVITPEDDLKKLGLTLFNSNVTSYAEFKITSESIKSTVTDNKEAADAAFNNLDNVVIPGINGRLDDVEEESGNNATWIYQNKDRIALVAAQFDDEGNLINTSGLVAKDDFISMFSTQVDDQGIAHTADLDVYVQYDKATGEIETHIKMNADMIEQVADQIDIATQSLTIKANQVSFTGDDTFEWEVKVGENRIFYLDHSGNLEIAGKLYQCELMDTLVIGESNRYFRVMPSSESDNRAAIRGFEGEDRAISIGWESDTYNLPTVELQNVVTWAGRSKLNPQGLVVYADNKSISLGFDQDGSVFLQASSYSGNTSAWPTTAGIHKGKVYVDGNGFLKVNM